MASSTTRHAPNPTPRRGDIWQVDLGRPIGAEIIKRRPAVVMSSDSVGVLPLKLVVPLTGWQSSFSGKIWLVRIPVARVTGLTKESTADVLQMQSVTLERFVTRLGRMPANLLDEIAAAIAASVEYQ
ncbi:MAG: type II toxin-antitoxin system PemK/MazF family toxin [Oscillochloridaceae bacterium umkhey_bin13]